mmetsp:Transcript_17142/g.39580  ORF Transcript_17142/g.39580 Transcript_17142/m.39580 type:complete len:219 (-) Transcript_17142:227-883(-)
MKISLRSPSLSSNDAFYRQRIFVGFSRSKNATIGSETDLGVVGIPSRLGEGFACCVTWMGPHDTRACAVTGVGSCRVGWLRHRSDRLEYLLRGVLRPEGLDAEASAAEDVVPDHGLALRDALRFQRQQTRREPSDVAFDGVDGDVRRLPVETEGFTDQPLGSHLALLGEASDHVDDHVRLLQSVVLPPDEVVPDDVQHVSAVPVPERYVRVPSEISLP